MASPRRPFVHVDDVLEAAIDQHREQEQAREESEILELIELPEFDAGEADGFREVGGVAADRPVDDLFGQVERGVVDRQRGEGQEHQYRLLRQAELDDVAEQRDRQAVRIAGGQKAARERRAAGVDGVSSCLPRCDLRRPDVAPTHPPVRPRPPARPQRAARLRVPPGCGAPIARGSERRTADSTGAILRSRDTTGEFAPGRPPVVMSAAADPRGGAAPARIRPWPSRTSRIVTAPSATMRSARRR